jgi:hypothetical protein
VRLIATTQRKLPVALASQVPTCAPASTKSSPVKWMDERARPILMNHGEIRTYNISNEPLHPISTGNPTSAIPRTSKRPASVGQLGMIPNNRRGSVPYLVYVLRNRAYEASGTFIPDKNRSYDITEGTGKCSRNTLRVLQGRNRKRRLPETEPTKMLFTLI